MGANSSKDGRLAGKVAVITGGAGGIGKAISERFAKEGAKLVIADVDAKAMDTLAGDLKEQGTDVRLSLGDVTTEPAANAAIAEAVDGFGRIDILINNVGGDRPGRMWEIPVEQWDAVLNRNLRGTFFCTRAAVPHMIKQRGGRIVCSSSGSREGTPWIAIHQGSAAYATAKAGLHGFIRDLAYELGEYGICINAVAIGPTLLERTKTFWDELEKTSIHHPKNVLPLRRLCTPVEMANIFLFLASDEASYVSGVTISTGGR